MMPTYMTLHNNSPKVDMTLPINASLLTISRSVFEEKFQKFSKLANTNQGKIKLPSIVKKNYEDFCVPKIWQILRHFVRIFC